MRVLATRKYEKLFEAALKRFVAKQEVTSEANQILVRIAAKAYYKGVRMEPKTYGEADNSVNLF